MIQVAENSISYDGNGVTTAFSYTFKIINASDIKVMTVDPNGVENILTSDYYVDMVASKVHYPGYAPGAEEPVAQRPPILPVGWRLIIYRDMPINQLTALDPHWPFKSIEDMCDKLTIICQQLASDISRAFKVSISGGDGKNLTIPYGKNKGIKWNALGTALELFDVLTANIVQTTGTSTTDIMSQNAVTKEFENHLYNASEKVYTGSSGAINTANGAIQVCSATTITMPSVKNGYTLTLVCTASDVTWSGTTIKWRGGSAPFFGSGDNIVTFLGVGNVWYGAYGGAFSNV